MEQIFEIVNQSGRVNKKTDKKLPYFEKIRCQLVNESLDYIRNKL